MTSHTEHSTTISAAALAAQLKATQEANTRLIAQVVELQCEYDRLRDAIQYAQTMGLPGHISAYLADALSKEQPSLAPPRAVDPPPHCWNCGLPLAGDGVHIARTGRTVTAHRVCADHLLGQGWELVAKRGDT
jgi:hypothetical protein